MPFYLCELPLQKMQAETNLEKDSRQALIEGHLTKNIADIIPQTCQSNQKQGMSQEWTQPRVKVD